MSMCEVEIMDNFPDGLVVESNAGAVSLLADAEVFSPEAVPSDSYGTHGHPREMAGEGFGRKHAVGLTTAVAGAAGADVPVVALGR